MATEKELYQRALAKLGDPDKAAAFVADYLSKKAPETKPSMETKPTNAAQKGDASVRPMGGSKGAVGKPAVAMPGAAAPKAVSPFTEESARAYLAGKSGGFGGSPGAARMADANSVSDAAKYGKWAAEEAVRKAAQDAASPFSRQRAERDRASAAAYYGPALTGADEQFNRDWMYGAGQIARLFREGENPAPKIAESPAAIRRQEDVPAPTTPATPRPATAYFGPTEAPPAVATPERRDPTVEMTRKLAEIMPAERIPKDPEKIKALYASPDVQKALAAD